MNQWQKLALTRHMQFQCSGNPTLESKLSNLSKFRFQMQAGFLILLCSLGKTSHGTAKLSSQTTEQFLAKFAFSPFATCNVKVNFKTNKAPYFDQHQHSLAMTLFSDTAWPQFVQAMQRGSLCVDRYKIATVTLPIKPEHHVDPLTGKERLNFDVQMTISPPKGRAHYWYAMIMDCYLEEYDAHPPQLDYNITFLNGESHLPADESGMSTINAIAMLSLVGYGVVYGMNMFRQYKQQKQGHLITLIFGAAYILQTASVFFELLHLRQFAVDGKGLRWRHTYFAADFLSGLLQSLSELVISLLLIALAFGWTLGLSSAPSEGAAGKMLEGLRRPARLMRGLGSPSTCILLGIGILQLVLQAYGRTFEEDFNNFHDLEHWPGLILVGIRVALAGLFGWAIQRSLSKQSDPEVDRFLMRLRLHGSCWFVASPILVMMAVALPPYRRHQLVAGGTIFFQSLALVMLSSLFVRDSEYYKISSLSQLGFSLDYGFSTPVGVPSRSNKMAVD